MMVSTDRKRDLFAVEDEPPLGHMDLAGRDDFEPPPRPSAPPDAFDGRDAAHDDLGPSHGVAIGVFLSIPVWIVVVTLLLLAFR